MEQTGLVERHGFKTDDMFYLLFAAELLRAFHMLMSIMTSSCECDMLPFPNLFELRFLGHKTSPFQHSSGNSQLRK